MRNIYLVAISLGVVQATAAAEAQSLACSAIVTHYCDRQYCYTRKFNHHFSIDLDANTMVYCAEGKECRPTNFVKIAKDEITTINAGSEFFVRIEPDNKATMFRAAGGGFYSTTFYSCTDVPPQS